MKERDEFIDILRFVLILFVFVNHLDSITIFFGLNQNFEDLLNHFCDFTSPSFAFISGYLLLFKSLFIKKFKDRSLFFLKRAVELMIPYVFWISILFVIVTVLKWGSVELLHKEIFTAKCDGGVRGFIRSLIYPEEAHIALTQFWFLKSLILMVFFSVILSNLYRFRILFVFLLIVSLFFDVQFISIRFYPYFLLGSFLGFNKVEVFARLKEIKFMHTIILAGVLAAVSLVPKVYLQGVIMSLIINLLCFFTLNGVLNWVTKSNAIKNCLVYFAGYSFYLFVLHNFVFAILSRTLFLLTDKGNLNQIFFVCILNVFISVGLTLLAVIVIQNLIKKHSLFFKISSGRLRININLDK